jgi:16S rRNA (cytosine967-C5)-methyltransferase
MSAREPARDDPGAGVRALAARVVHRVAERGENLDAALAAELDPALPGRDQARVQALAYGSLRWHHLHRALIGRLLHRPLRPRDRILESLLSVGLYQLREPRQPGYATVSATVAAARLLDQPRAAGMINALLRKFQREGAGLVDAVAAASDQARWSHPQWLIDALRADWPGQHEQLLGAAQQPPPMWLRVNLMRISAEAWPLLPGAPAVSPQWPVLPAALKLAVPVDVAMLPGFADGLVSVQDAAAQLAALLLAPGPGMRVLDACAAPGGKAAHLLETAGGDLALTALDSDPQRLARVSQTLQRLGLKAQVIAGDATRPADWWDGDAYDRILIDAPCSGIGVIRRHPDIKLLRRPGDIAALAARQQAMLAALWPLLRPGGRLLYATCSLLRDENDRVLASFLATTPGARMVASELPAQVGAVTLPGAPGWYLLPGAGGAGGGTGPAEDTDGFYYGLIERLPD